MKKIVIIMTIILVSGCSLVKKNNNIEVKESSDSMNSVNINIDGREYILNLEDNNTTKELVNMLPLSITMNELNGNEKYYYLDSNLSTNNYNPGTINKGDVMLYGSNCLVVFYKSFDTSYSYTKIGHIDNLDDLDSGNIEVKIYRGGSNE